MSREVTTGLYEFDPGMSNSANLITNERQVVHSPERDDFHFLIPLAAPFFVESLEVRNDATGALLVEGKDYVVGHWFAEAMDSTGRPIAGSIRLLDHNFSGIIRLNYHTLGGEWGFDDQTILEELAKRQLNPLIRTWAQVAPLPRLFPPTPHDQRVDTIIGADDLLDRFGDLVDSVVTASDALTSTHINDFENPHRVNKDQVHLGNVENYPPATKQQAEAGLLNNIYMTSLRTAEAIEAQVGATLQQHIEDLDNPHGTDKRHVGLGEVENYRTATPAEAIEGLRNDLYLTPLTALALLQNNGYGGGGGGGGGSIEIPFYDHLADYNNPHRVTAEQVDAYTKDEVQALMGNVSATDTPRFEGLTGDEWRATLPSHENLEEIITTLQDEYSEATSGAGQIAVEMVSPPEYVPVLDVAAGWGSCVIYLQDSTAVEIPYTGRIPDRVEAWPGEITTLPDASYRIIEDGYIVATGNQAVPIPPTLQPGAEAPDPAPVELTAAPGLLYVVYDNGRISRIDSGGVVTMPQTDVDSVYISWDDVNNAVVLYSDGTVGPIGETPWVNAAGAALSGHTDVAEVAVGETFIAVRGNDESVTVYTVSRSGGNYTINPLPLGSEYTTNIISISGCYRHLVFLTSDGEVFTWGDNTDYQRDLPENLGVVLEVQAGRDYTLTLEDNGRVTYWGRDEDNLFIIPDNFEPIQGN